MSKQSKARDKAFRTAAEYEAGIQDYDRLAPAPLESWISEYIKRHGETWQVVWDAARTWTNKQWRARIVDLETHLIAARHSAGVVQRAVSSLEASVAGRDEDIKRLTSNLEQTTATAKLRLGRIQEQERSIHLSMTANTALRTELDRLKAESVEIATRHQKQLEELRPLTTSGAKEAYQNVERLARELAATTDLLIRAEDEAKEEREQRRVAEVEVKRLEGMRDSQGAALRSCMQKRDQLINENAILGDRIAKLTEPQPRPVICPVTKGGHIHKCVEEHAEPFRIAPHTCSCGHRWYSPEQRTRR